MLPSIDRSEERQRQVLTKAVRRVQDRLRVRNVQLAAVLGVSASTISRLDHAPLRNAKAIELGTLFVRLYRSLIGVVGADAPAALWLGSPNRALGGRPIDRIQSVTGLVGTIEYLDAMRAKT